MFRAWKPLVSRQTICWPRSSKRSTPSRELPSRPDSEHEQLLGELNHRLEESERKCELALSDVHKLKK